MADDAASPAPTTRLGLILRSLRHRNFRLFFVGQGISLIGTWMQQLAMSWLVFKLTYDALKMGAVTFAAQIPSFLLIPFIGVFLDRWHRHRVVIATQFLAMVQAFILAGLVMGGVIVYWQLIALSVVMGCINAFDMPARQSFLPEMLTNKDDLANAIALNSSLFNAARLVGPAVAGFLIALVGEAWCFLLNALSFIAVLAALLAMRIPRRQRPAQHRNVMHGIREGFVYAFGFPPIRALILLVAMLSLVGIPYTVLMPLFAAEVLHGGAGTLGLLMTASGVGALTGAIYMASRHTVLGLGVRITGAAFLFGLSLIGFALSTNLWLSLVLLAFAGLGIMVTMSGCNTILQTIVEEHMRGRVMSLYTMAFMGVAPFGSLLAGWLADKIDKVLGASSGAPYTVLAGGIATLAGTALFAHRLGTLRRFIRPIYIAKGILPPPAPADEPVPGLVVAPDGPAFSALASAAEGDADKMN